MTPLALYTEALMAAVEFQTRRDPDAPRRDVTLRREIAAESEHLTLSSEGHAAAYDLVTRLRAMAPAGMPPDPNDTALLLDTIAFRYGFETRADTWRALGIHPDRGRDMLGRGRAHMDWPVWFTMVAYAVGEKYPLPVHAKPPPKANPAETSG